MPFVAFGREQTPIQTGQVLAFPPPIRYQAFQFQIHIGLKGDQGVSRRCVIKMIGSDESASQN